MPNHTPSEILDSIFLEIYNDRFLPYNRKIHYLYNCLLVNRLWCKNAISLLWSIAFAFNLKKTSKHRMTIVDSCLKFINKEQQTELLKSGIQIDATPSLFNYPSFIKDVKFEILLLFLRYWAFTRHSFAADHNLILRILLEVLTENGTNLVCFVSDHLSLGLGTGVAENIRLPSKELTILGNNNIKNMFENVNELWIGSRSLEKNFISVIANICHNVKTMIVSFEPFDSYSLEEVSPENVSELISSQKNLKSFTLISYRGTSYSFLNSLETQSHSLERVHIRSTFFKSGGPNLNGIAECKLLKALVIEDCENITLKLVEPLMNAKFYMLTYVYFNCPYSSVCDEITEWAKCYDNEGKKMNYLYKGEKVYSRF